MQLSAAQRRALPKWAGVERLDDGEYRILMPPAVYGRYLGYLGEQQASVYWAEVARRCATEDIRRSVGIFSVVRGDDVLAEGLGWRAATTKIANMSGARATLDLLIDIRIPRDPAWRLGALPRTHPELTVEEEADMGAREWRRHYDRLSSAAPAKDKQPAE